MINKKLNPQIDLQDTCFDCGNQCCKLGGVVATQNEVDAITKLEYPNHFVKLSTDVYGIEWENGGTCAYLENGKCSIYSVRPLGCRMFPVVQTQNHDIILVKCPLSSFISDDEIGKRRQILLQRPKDIIRKSEQIRSDHIKEVAIRASKYNYLKL